MHRIAPLLLILSLLSGCGASTQKIAGYAITGGGGLTAVVGGAMMPYACKQSCKEPLEGVGLTMLVTGSVLLVTGLALAITAEPDPTPSPMPKQPPVLHDPNWMPPP